MPKILAIDCSLNSCSAALQVEDYIDARFMVNQRGQTQQLLHMIDDLLTAKQLKLSQLDALAFAHGPGNFTGIRVAASLIQGLAFATNLPVVPVSTLQTLAQNCFYEHQVKNVLVAIDAYMGEIFWGVYKIDKDEIMMPIIADSLTKPEQIKIPSDELFFAVGNAWNNEELLNKYRARLSTANKGLRPHAREVAKIAEMKFTEGQFVKAEEALPVYLRGAEAWKKIDDQR